MWRWDQGRLTYFQYDVLRKTAKVLVKFDKADISSCEPLFRSALVSETGMPFLPETYTIKRNYSRVFQCSFLATFVDDRIVPTDFCRNLANDKGLFNNVDDYLFNLIPRFRFPFPAFENYNSAEIRSYPFCAVLKFLIARQEIGADSKISLDDAFSYIVGNGCTGLEDLAHYTELEPVEYHCTEAERRQLREMLIFISQLSILKMYDGYLWLENLDQDSRNELIATVLTPQQRNPQPDRAREFLEMTSLATNVHVPRFDILGFDPFNVAFVEGDRRRAEHFRIERSVLLRKYYQKANPSPKCRACGQDMRVRYPWTDYMLEIHHLLPLSSSIGISLHGTSLDDIVGLCPSCHRAIHLYYRKWLERHKKSDFSSKQEAFDVFLEAKKEISK